MRSYSFLLPAYAVHVLHTDARGLGWLMAATGIGAVGGALLDRGREREAALDHLVRFGLDGLARRRRRSA